MSTSIRAGRAADVEAVLELWVRGAAEPHLSAVGAVRLQVVVVDTETLATGFWRATAWTPQDHRIRFVRG